jgi:hypothetical protein
MADELQRDPLTGATPEGYIMPPGTTLEAYEHFLQEQALIDRTDPPRTSTGERMATLSGGYSSTADTFRRVKGTRH